MKRSLKKKNEGENEVHIVPAVCQLGVVAYIIWAGQQHEENEQISDANW